MIIAQKHCFCNVYLGLNTNQQQFHPLLDNSTNLLPQLVLPRDCVMQVLDQRSNGRLVDHDRCDALEQRFHVRVHVISRDCVAHFVKHFFLFNERPTHIFMQTD